MEQALPRRTAGIPRTWSLCMTSENHGTVGKAGDPFSHAPGKHERVQVVEIVAAGTPPAPDVDLAGLVRIDVTDLVDKLGDVFTWARELPIPTRGASSAMRKVSEVKDALAAAPIAAQADQVTVPAEQLEWSHDLQERLIAAGQDFDEHESVRQVMAEAACLLAALTGVRVPASGERQEGGA
jgi:hypothetical protein